MPNVDCWQRNRMYTRVPRELLSEKRSTERNVPVEIEAEVKSFEVTVNLAAKSAGFEQAILYA